MGRGHSGSTVLDALLGNSSEIESVGELVSGLVKSGAQCSCGKILEDCEVWQDVKSRFEKTSAWPMNELVSLSSRQAHIRNFLGALLAPKTDKGFRHLGHLTTLLTSSIVSATNKKAALDSSKEVTRGLFLIRYVPKAKVIHLVRNPEGILASNLFRIRSGTGFRFLRRNYSGKGSSLFLLVLSSFSWLIGNILAELVKCFGRERVMRVRHEDLCTNPVGELKRVEAFLECDLSNVVEAVMSGSEMKIGHTIGGNRIRMDGVFTFNPSAGAKRSLPKAYKLLARAFCWPMMLKYGYL